ncbi:Gp138 family membrane-puncturing spike protein [uncultured Bacteroides sp.]|uniref:Gp138 family membrane-puncturing spike protein n=1 Tax=uncultured Bacteroides sp. TaxID=162156 RepID=UPI0025974985|nr:Gp138 family membrane-puncturing spike protein [uncultured Bacteroides sp.]
MPKVNEYNYQQIHDRKLAESICVAAVVQVMAFDSAKMTVDVQPLSKHLENGSYESQPPILGVPIACTRSGGFIFRPWFKSGDTGVVVYLDHDSDSTVAGGKEAEPITERNHSSSDAIFVGAIVSGSYTVKGIPDESVALASEDGKIYVAVEKDKIEFKNEDTTVEIAKESVDVKTKDFTVDATGNVKIKGAGNGVNIGG